MDNIQELKIVVTEPGSEAFYKETVNVIGQYRQLLKKPERKLKDVFKVYRNNLILMIVFFAILLAMCVLSYLWKDLDAMMIAALVLPAIAAFLNAYYLKNCIKLVKRFRDEHQTTVVTLDAGGIENKTDRQTVRLAWDGVAFARVFRESVAFLSSGGSGIVMTVDRKYESTILDWMKANKPTVRIVSF